MRFTQCPKIFNDRINGKFPCFINTFDTRHYKYEPCCSCQARFFLSQNTFFQASRQQADWGKAISKWFRYLLFLGHAVYHHTRPDKQLFCLGKYFILNMGKIKCYSNYQDNVNMAPLATYESYTIRRAIFKIPNFAGTMWKWDLIPQTVGFPQFHILRNNFK